jgi:hypothetical protein
MFEIKQKCTLFMEVSMETCLTNDNILEYISGKMDKTKKLEIDKHLTTCKLCRDDLMLSNQLLKDPSLNLDMKNRSLCIPWQRIDKSRQYKFNDLKIRINSFLSYLFPIQQAQFAVNQYAYAKSFRNPIKKNNELSYIQLNKSFGNIYLIILFEKFEEDKYADIFIKLTQKSKNENNIRLILEKDSDGNIHSIPLIGQSKRFENLDFGNYKLTVKQHAIKKGELQFRVAEDGYNEF